MSSSLFIALLLNESTSDAEDYAPLYEELTILIRANNLDDAHAKALAQGGTLTHSFENAKGETIHWKFRTVVDIVPVLSEDLGEVTELYCRHFHDIEAYERFEVRLGITDHAR